MQTFQLAFVLIFAVLVSYVISKFIPKVSSPIIQIVLGMLLSILFLGFEAPSLDPDMFMLVFIAPLLYIEARSANIVELWNNRRRILSLAIGLVLVIMLAIGGTAYLLIPALPFAAACCMGAALGPTDVVAVTSLKSSVKLGKKESSILQGEVLINDASGIVTFSFAVTATITGGLSIADAVTTFLVEFFGGIVVGVALAMVIHKLLALFHERGFETLVFDVMAEVMIPFVMYMAADAIHTSGVLAVVAGGIVLGAYGDRVMSPSSAQFGIARSTVFGAVRFVLEGIVFLLLGLHLPQIFYLQFTDTEITNGMLVLFILILTAVLVGVRLLWIFAGEVWQERKRKRAAASGDGAESGPMEETPVGDQDGFGAALMAVNPSEEEEEPDDVPLSDHPNLRHALITTLGGAKGTVTLSIIMSIPYLMSSGVAFPYRELLIFLTSGVIFCTLILANVFLPILSPAPKQTITTGMPETDEEYAEIRISILNSVVKRLLDNSEKYNAAALHSVVISYDQRVSRMRSAWDIDSEETVKLRLQLLDVQEAELDRIERSGIAREASITQNRLRLERSRRFLTHEGNHWHTVITVLRHPLASAKMGIDYMVGIVKRFLGYPVKPSKVNVRQMLEEKAIEYLEDLRDSGTSNVPEDVIEERLMTLRSSAEGVSVSPFNVAVFARKSPELMELERTAYNIELDEITKRVEDGTLSRSGAKKLRDNVYMMMVDLGPNF